VFLDLQREALGKASRCRFVKGSGGCIVTRDEVNTIFLHAGEVR
jgi:hypothetical protein